MRLFFPERQGLQRKWPPASRRRGASRKKKPGRGHCSGKPGPAGGRARDWAAASGGGRRKVQEDRVVCFEERRLTPSRTPGTPAENTSARCSLWFPAAHPYTAYSLPQPVATRRTARQRGKKYTFRPHTFV